VQGIARSSDDSAFVQDADRSSTPAAVKVAEWVQDGIRRRCAKGLRLYQGRLIGQRTRRPWACRRKRSPAAKAIAGLQPRLKLSQDLIRLRLHHMILTLDIIVNILIIIILTIGVCM
jgi:hypothetical protein